VKMLFGHHIEHGKLSEKRLAIMFPDGTAFEGPADLAYDIKRYVPNAEGIRSMHELRHALEKYDQRIR
jgi:hypothetical protein